MLQYFYFENDVEVTIICYWNIFQKKKKKNMPFSLFQVKTESNKSVTLNPFPYR